MGTDTVKNHPEDCISNCDSVTSGNNYSSTSTVQANSVGLQSGVTSGKNSSGGNPNTGPGYGVFHRQLQSQTSSLSVGGVSAAGDTDSFTSTSSIVVGNIQNHILNGQRPPSPNQFEPEPEKNAKKKTACNTTASTNGCDGDIDDDDGDKEEFRPTFLSAKDQLPLESPTHCKGIINRLIDKDLIRTAIMEQDEENLPRGIQQGYFKVRAANDMNSYKPVIITVLPKKLVSGPIRVLFDVNDSSRLCAKIATKVEPGN